jgi:hypothetical protein
MRAICGAIITAGALIGLGLTAVGIGTRYENSRALSGTGDDSQPLLIKMHQMDRPLIFILVFLTCVAIIGIGIAIAGLAYHHHRREREHAWERERVAHPRTTV